MNTRKHTIRSAFLIFLCMMLMMCITACGEKETKEYPDIGIELSLNENYVTNIKEQSKKEFQNSVYSLKEIGRYTGNNIEGYLYQFNESTGRFHNNNSYAAYLIKSVDNGYLCTIIVASNAKDSNLIDYILEKFKNEFGELKFEKV